MKREGCGKKVLVAMSGGVDSSVAAALLKEQGYEVVGCFMRLGSDDSVEAADTSDWQACDSGAAGADGGGKQGHQGCCSLNDAADARLVAATLDVPFYVLNFKKEFGRIIDYFVGEYNRGRTPNPCIRCNNWLKFGKLVAYAQSIDADFVATGHYAQVEHTSGRSRLLQGKDHRKDQSYVLFGTPRPRLRHMLLPVGALEKRQVRALAKRWKLPVFDKPDSQEICFVPDNNYFGLVKRHSPDRVAPGQVVDEDGRIVGEHDGHQRFTIGQRRGLSVALGYPIYVTDKNPQTNTVTVGPSEKTYAHALSADQVNWLVDPPGNRSIRCTAKIRSNGPAEPASVRTTGPDALEVHFDQPQRAVSPGQAVVCYVGAEVIGGGWISKVESCESRVESQDS